MKITAIIAEYNPFHNGHLFHLQTARQKTDCDYLIIVMSGDYVQRGTPALLNKYRRTEMALRNGADLVIELPTIFSTSSAEYFSEGAIGLLDSLGCITSLCFGTETADTTKLKLLAQELQNTNSTWQENIKYYLAKGYSYPKARSSSFLDNICSSEKELYSNLLNQPNNILAIEYEKALYRRKSSIQTIPILRTGKGYHDPELSPNSFCSATAIRNLVKTESSDCFHLLEKQLPPATLPLLFRESFQNTFSVFPLWEDDFSPYLQYALWNTPKLSHFLDMNEELEHRLLRNSSPNHSFSQYVADLKNKSYTQTRIQRALLHILLNITTTHMSIWKQQNFAGYSRILGFKKNASPLLKHIKTHSSIPIIQKIPQAKKQLPTSFYQQFTLDLKAHQLYEITFCQKYKQPFKYEASIPPIVL